jgi:hypothetical protein
VIEPEPDSGPVLVTVEWRIDPSDPRTSRMRWTRSAWPGETGATRWGLCNEELHAHARTFLDGQQTPRVHHLMWAPTARG